LQFFALGVRDAVVVDSLQRIAHLKIATYRSVATFARMLNRVEDAARFAEALTPSLRLTELVCRLPV